MNRRLRASGVHLLVNACVAGAFAMLVFWVWYPYPFASLAGGLGLFGILVSVDVVLGPILTAVAAAPAKPIGELRRDIALIVVVQVAAFAYGAYVIASVRPVYLSFEVDRFRVVTAADIDKSTLKDAPTDLQALPWTGPQLIAAVKPTDPNEQVHSIELGLSGFDLSMIPRNWRTFASQRDAAWHVSRPATALLAKYPEQATAVGGFATAAGQNVDAVRFLPVLSRRASWVALLAPPDARVIGYLPVEGFF